LLIFDEVTDKTKLAPFFMAHGVCVYLLLLSEFPNSSGYWFGLLLMTLHTPAKLFYVKLS